MLTVLVIKMKKKKIERWDEHLVIAVMVVSAICILIMLTSFMSVTGKATTSIISSDGVLNKINTGTFVITGDGPTKCDYECGKEKMYAFVSHNGDEFVENSQIISGDYTCTCIKH